MYQTTFWCGLVLNVLMAGLCYLGVNNLANFAVNLSMKILHFMSAVPYTVVAQLPHVIVWEWLTPRFNTLIELNCQHESLSSKGRYSCNLSKTLSVICIVIISSKFTYQFKQNYIKENIFLGKTQMYQSSTVNLCR